MAVFKCKMCGGNLEIQEGMTVCECEYCGSNQTVPSLDDEKKVNLFTRANRLRSACEFDKAFGVYESIVTEFNEEAEAYWGLILCKYGIEYVDDPKTGKKIPTCHRSSFDSVMDDANFEMVMEYSDPTSRSVYREEAKAIETLRTGIIEVSSKEEPYDIFICYKETDPVGQRTIDSVIAQDVYDALTEKGYRVFFSRITLEDKLGQEYEPYIFAALNSAKVMLAFGTDYEYYNAVWVKNEWSRFLGLIEKGEKKTLIPCYKGIDAYDMPKEFAKLQGQDMGKVGAIQDLVRGIGKILQKDEPDKVVVHETTGIGGSNASVDSLLKRVFMFLEDRNWDSADEYCEKVLDLNPECAHAYLGKLMAELKVNEQEKLKDCEELFDENINYKKAIRFGDDSFKNTLVSYVEYIKERNENVRLEAIYLNGLFKMKDSRDAYDYEVAAGIFKTITYYKDADILYSTCLEECENEKQKEKEKKEKLSALTEEYKNAIQLKKEQQLIEKDISSLNSKKNSMTQFKNEWLELDRDLNKLENMILPINQEISNLKKEKERLGLFSGKRKKEIDEKISELKVELHSLEHKKLVSKLNRNGYDSIPEIDNELNHIEEELMKQNNMLEKISNNRTCDVILKEVDKYMSVDAFLNVINLSNAKKGDYVHFGKYYQKDNVKEKQEIEWLVLEKIEGKALVISRYALDCKPYNEHYEDITWEKCSLRSWLNNSFIADAFNVYEQVHICETIVTADKNPDYSTNPGNDTQDRIFLLSINEVNMYFYDESEKECIATKYAQAQGVRIYDDDLDESCWWWLRSPGDKQYKAATVDYGGDIREDGGLGSISDNYAVRPAMWINLEA